MESLIYTTTRMFFTSMLILLIAAFSTFAQKPVNENAIKNLAAGIQSENEGLKRSAIYFAGKYQYSEVTGILVEQLKTEKNPSTKLLIAHALYRIGDPVAMENVFNLSENDSNAKVRRIAGAIYETFRFAEYETNGTELVQEFKGGNDN